MKMLGKDPAVIDKDTLQIVKYLPRRLPPVPTTVRWDEIKKPLGADGNFIYGNCVPVAKARIIDYARANESGRMTDIPESRVIALSREMGALNGYVMLDCLKYWRTVGMWATKIKGFAAVKRTSEVMRYALFAFGHLDTGLMMPSAWESRDVWDTGFGWSYRKGSWGGHDAAFFGFDPKGFFVRSWDKIYYITNQAVDKYCDEMFVVLLKAWWAKDQITPSGIDCKQLEKDIVKVSR